MARVTSSDRRIFEAEGAVAAMVKEDLNLGGLFDAAVEIAERHQKVMVALRKSLERNDVAGSLELARKLTGLTPTPEKNR